MNVFKEKTFTRDKHNRKDEFSVDVRKQVAMWQIWFPEEACSRQRRLRRRTHKSSRQWTAILLATKIKTIDL